MNKQQLENIIRYARGLSTASTFKVLGINTAGGAGGSIVSGDVTTLVESVITNMGTLAISEQASHPAAETTPILYFYNDSVWFKLSIADGGGAAGSATGATDLTNTDIILDNDTPVNAVAASETLTISGLPSDNDTVTVGTDVYTFENAIAAGGVKASSILTYSGVAADSETVTIDTTTYTYKTALTEAKGTATLTFSGTVDDGEIVSIDSRNYEFDTNSSIVGDVAVNISGGTKVQASSTLTLSGVLIEGEYFRIGNEVYEIDANGIISGASSFAVDVSAFMTASQGTLTLGGAIPSADEAITVGSQTYTWKATLTGAADEILIGGSIDDCIDYFTYAVNAGIGEGVAYGTGTVANASATAAKTGATTAVLTAIVYGVVGDSIATTTTMADGANIFDAGTLGTTTAGVDCPAADADGVMITTFTNNTALAITASQGAGTTIDFTATAAGVLDGSAGNAIISDGIMANGSFSAATLIGGSDATANEASAALHAAITGDGSADVSSVDGTGSVVVTALVVGTVGNYVTGETLTNGSWSGNLVGGLDAVVNEILVAGTAEGAIDNLVAACTNGAGEGTTYSTGTVAHTTCDITKESASELKAEFKTIGDAGNATPIAETGTQLAWTGGAVFLAGGEDVEAAYGVLIGVNAEACIDNLVAAINHTAGEGTTYGTGTLINADVTATKASASTMDADAKISGVIGDVIPIDESGTNLAWAGGATVLSGGVDGTVGVAGAVLYDATNMYICTATNTIADANWKKLVLQSL